MQSKIEQQVMAGVGVIYLARKVFSRAAVAVYVLAASALALWQLVWVHKVFENFAMAEHYGLSSMSNYMVAALQHAHLGVQLALIAAALAAGALMVELVKSQQQKQFAF